MSILSALIQIEAWLFLAAVTATVLHRLVTGRINIGETQLNRAQLLLAVIAVAAYYVEAVVRHGERAMLPSVPGAVIAALGGSNVIHLVSALIGRWPEIVRSNKIT